VDDLEAVVDELTAHGVSFERYDEPRITTDEKGIAVVDGSKGAWFTDPDGNIFGLIQG
jgi:catechol 2,3-dioxygenase-like lactoylglutathione lyase family enzyme